MTANDYLNEMYYMKAHEKELMQEEYNRRREGKNVDDIFKYWSDERPKFIKRFMEACVDKEIDINEMNISYVFSDFDYIRIELPDRSNFEVSVSSLSRGQQYKEFLEMINKTIVENIDADTTVPIVESHKLDCGPVSEEFIARELLFEYNATKTFEYLAKFEDIPGLDELEIPELNLRKHADYLMNIMGVGLDEKSDYIHKFEALIMMGKVDKYELDDFPNAFPAITLEILRYGDSNWDCDQCCKILKDIKELSTITSSVTLATKAELMLNSPYYCVANDLTPGDCTTIAEETLFKIQDKINWFTEYGGTEKYYDTIDTYNRFLSEAICKIVPQNIERQLNLLMRYDIYTDDYISGANRVEIADALLRNDDTIRFVKDNDAILKTDIYERMMLLTSRELGIDYLKDLIDFGNQEISKAKEPEYNYSDNMTWMVDKRFMFSREVYETKIAAISSAIEYQLREFNIYSAQEQKVEDVLEATRTFISGLKDLGIDEEANFIQAALAKQFYATKEDVDGVNISNARVIENFKGEVSGYLDNETIKDGIETMDSDNKSRVALLFAHINEQGKRFCINKELDSQICFMLVDDNDVSYDAKLELRCSETYLRALKDSIEPDIIDAIEKRVKSGQNVANIIEVMDSDSEKVADLYRMADLIKSDMYSKENSDKVYEDAEMKYTYDNGYEFE